MAAKNTTTSLERATNMCCCFFLAAGLLNSLYQMLPLELFWPLYQPLAWACWAGPLLTLVLIALALNIRRLGLPVLILVFVVLLHIIELWPRWWATISAFFHWWQAGAIANIPAFSSAYNILLHLLTAWVLTLCLWLLLTRRPTLWLLLGCCLAALAGMYIYGLRGYGTTLYLLAAGLLPWAAASSVRRASMARSWAAALALPLTALIIGSSILLLPADTSTLRWAAWSDKVDEVRQQARELYRAWQMRDVALESVDLREEYHSHLGGPISPDNTRMLTVKTNSPQLLKASTYDTYTGQGWQKSAFYTVSILNNVFRNKNADISGLPLFEEKYDFQLDSILNNGFSADGGPHSLAPFIKETEATVTLLHPAEPRLFYWGQPTDFSSKDEIVPLLNEESEMTSATTLKNGYTYTFSALVLDRSQPGFTEAMAKITPRLTVEELNQQQTRTNMQSLATQLPTLLVVSNDYAAYRKMLREMIDSNFPPDRQASLYEEAVLIERWLKANCHYTLNPLKPQAKKDFVMNFLYTREGYCTYYASAMVVFARMMGIPARYVTGYKLEPIRGVNKYAATNATAHAWAELYFTDVGWLPFDATGLVDFTEQRDGLTANMRDRDFFGPDPTGAYGGISPGGWRLILTLLSLIIVATLLFRLVWRRAQRIYSLPWLLTRWQHNAILELYYRSLLAQLSLLGWQRKSQETILGFTRRISIHLPEQAAQLYALGAAVSALRYGGQSPSTADLAAAAALHQYFEAMLRKELKVNAYLRYRLRQGFTVHQK